MDYKTLKIKLIFHDWQFKYLSSNLDFRSEVRPLGHWLIGCKLLCQELKFVAKICQQSEAIYHDTHGWAESSNNKKVK